MTENHLKLHNLKFCRYLEKMEEAIELKIFIVKKYKE